MSQPDLEARCTIEALRSGVPSEAAVRTLATSQAAIEERFLERIQNPGSRPLVIEANFGDGKSHLLHHLRTKAEGEGFGTSIVTLGPETPLGNAHVTLKAIAEEARAPGHTGKAVLEMAASGRRQAAADLRLWARDADIQDRFRALLRVYEATQDDELRVQLLNDLEGRPVLKTTLARELRDLGEASQYDLKSPRNPLLAHDRIQILAQFCKAHGAKGLVIFFDELERLVTFSFKARVAAYEEIGWWRTLCEAGTTPIHVVFAQTAGWLEQCLAIRATRAGSLHPFLGMRATISRRMASICFAIRFGWNAPRRRLSNPCSTAFA